jgi:hypothetical protein
MEKKVAAGARFARNFHNPDAKNARGAPRPIKFIFSDKISEKCFPALPKIYKYARAQRRAPDLRVYYGESSDARTTNPAFSILAPDSSLATQLAP